TGRRWIREIRRETAPRRARARQPRPSVSSAPCPARTRLPLRVRGRTRFPRSPCTDYPEALVRWQARSRSCRLTGRLGPDLAAGLRWACADSNSRSEYSERLLPTYLRGRAVTLL